MKNMRFPTVSRHGKNNPMYSAPALAIKYLQYYLKASNGKGHGIHSPFVYEFVREVLIDKREYPAYQVAEDYWRKTLSDHTMLDVVDLGAGSVKMGKPGTRTDKKGKSETSQDKMGKPGPESAEKGKHGTGSNEEFAQSAVARKRKVSDIARTSVKPKRYSRLLFRIAQFYGYSHIIELGTSLGVTSTYLALVPSVGQFITMEGSESIAAYAGDHFQKAVLRNISLIRGNFDDQLNDALEKMETVDMAFIDGNHRKAPTLDYFNKIMRKTNEYSCIVFDDIHWSREMEEAWEEIKKDDRVKLSIDLFFVGVVFFRKSFLEKQDFIIRF
jgi:predicted O-methyltransferase YrrM